MNGVKLHFVEGSEGQRTVVLIPGWPQTWYAWRKIMPDVANTYHVVALDIRGMGESSRPESGYDTETLANDISALMDQLGISRYSVVGHDIGMWIAYSLAAKHGAQVDKLVVSEAFIPGISPTPPMLQPPEKSAALAQFMFNQLRDLPEFLVSGREASYLRWNVEHRAYWPDRVAVDEYIRAYSVPGAMRAGFEYYRAIPLTMHQNQELKKRKLIMPVMAIGAAFGSGETTVATMKSVSDSVKSKIVAQCGHYIPEECPEEFLNELMPFLAE